MRVALIGRPNVGKSTLFNRLVGRRQSVVSPVQGTTRDRVQAPVTWRGRTFTLVDAGGVDAAPDSPLAHAIQAQVQRAITDADVVLWVCDAQAGLLPADELLLQRLRKSAKPVRLIVNKVDQGALIPAEFYACGVGEPLAVSALHGRGIEPLLQLLSAQAPLDTTPAPVPALSLALVGRQNVGKSSLFNALLREERAIVSDVPGTTRDTLDTLLTIDGQLVRVLDTAGLRHRRKVRYAVDFFAMSRTLDTLRQCDVAAVLLDATQGVTRDDHRIIQHVADAGCGVVILANKWDLLKKAVAAEAAKKLHAQIPSLTFAPVLAVSAKTGFQAGQVLPQVKRVWQTLRQPPSEAQLSRWVHLAWQAKAPPRFLGRVIRIKRVAWFPGRPVRLVLTTSPLAGLQQSYQHYLKKQLYRHDVLHGIPIELSVAQPDKRRARKVRA